MVASEENKEYNGMVAVAFIKLVVDNSIIVKMDPAVVVMVKDCRAIIVEATLMNSKVVKYAKTMTIEVEEGIIMTEVMVIVTVQIDTSMITTEVEDGTIMIEMLVVNNVGMNEGIDILIGNKTSVTRMMDEEGGNVK
eukprot:6790958-Ditylum_brightwellii.AAC.1